MEWKLFFLFNNYFIKLSKSYFYTTKILGYISGNVFYIFTKKHFCTGSNVFLTNF